MRRRTDQPEMADYHGAELNVLLARKLGHSGDPEAELTQIKHDRHEPR